MADNDAPQSYENGDRREGEGDYEREREKAGTPPPRDDGDRERDEPRDRDQEMRERSPYESSRRDRETSPRRKPPPPPPGRQEAQPTNVLGCFGLSIRTRDVDLEDEFSRYGEVEKAVIVYDQRSERSRGFGFVTMKNVDDAATCIEKLNGIELHGRNIRVAFSQTQRPHQSTPGQYMGFKSGRDDRDRGGFRSRGGYGDRDRDRDYRRDDRDRDRPRRDYDDRRDYPRRDDRDDRYERRRDYDDRDRGGYERRRDDYPERRRDDYDSAAPAA